MASAERPSAGEAEEIGRLATNLRSVHVGYDGPTAAMLLRSIGAHVHALETVELDSDRMDAIDEAITAFIELVHRQAATLRAVNFYCRCHVARPDLGVAMPQLSSVSVFGDDGAAVAQWLVAHAPRLESLHTMSYAGLSDVPDEVVSRLISLGITAVDLPATLNFSRFIRLDSLDFVGGTVTVEQLRSLPARITKLRLRHDAEHDQIAQLSIAIGDPDALSELQELSLGIWPRSEQTAAPVLKLRELLAPRKVRLRVYPL